MNLFSHEVRSALTVIQLYIELVEYWDNEQHALCFQQIYIQIRELVRLFDQSFQQVHEQSHLSKKTIHIIEHYFRTPLTVIQLSTEILERYPTIKREEHFKQIHQEIEYLAQLIDVPLEKFFLQKEMPHDVLHFMNDDRLFVDELVILPS